MKKLALWLIAPALLTAGCASTKTEKASLQRGWIGGEYNETKGKTVPEGRRRTVYVTQVHAGTPVAQAGLQPADLILAVNGQSLARVRDLQRYVDTAPPGSKVALSISRNGQTLELPVTIGRETFQQWHAVSMGLGLSAQADLWPNSDFSLFSLLRYNFKSNRVDLRSAESVLARQNIGRESTDEAGTRSDEGWNVWFVLIGFDAHKRILSQEPAAPQTASVAR